MLNATGDTGADVGCCYGGTVAGLPGLYCASTWHLARAVTGCMRLRMRQWLRFESDSAQRNSICQVAPTGWWHDAWSRQLCGGTCHCSRAACCPGPWSVQRQSRSVLSSIRIALRGPLLLGAQASQSRTRRNGHVEVQGQQGQASPSAAQRLGLSMHRAVVCLAGDAGDAGCSHIIAVEVTAGGCAKVHRLGADQYQLQSVAQCEMEAGKW